MLEILTNSWVTLILSNVLSWLTAYIFYRKGGQEQAQLFAKLPNEVREAILSAPATNETLKTKDLIKLLDELRKEPIDASRIVGSIDGGTF